MTKTASIPAIDAGEDAVFDIVVTNLGPGTAANVTLSDLLPNGGTVSGTDAADCTIEEGVLTCSFGDLEPEDERSITLTIPTTEANCPVVENTATVIADNENKAALENNESMATVESPARLQPRPAPRPQRLRSHLRRRQRPSVLRWYHRTPVLAAASAAA